MLFNSIDFAIFLPIVFLLYWFVLQKNLKVQNALLLASSYVFYGWWDWRFLGLIFISTLVDYVVGLQLSKQKESSYRKIWLWVSIVVNLGLLGYFKYFHFFVESFKEAFTFLGASFMGNTLQIVLPVGISFYTFQTLSYSIDVYKRRLEPTKNFVAFAAFVSFFPQLVAGPIERAKQLLPQFYTRRNFNYNSASDGMRQILWGLIKKIVIADNCAVYVNHIFDTYLSQPGSLLILGAVLFSFQIYGDFSGYSDIAIGTARLFGFNLSQNFAFPYFSRDIAEFWRRWHISLSTWFRDYLYIPLGGSKGPIWKRVRNIFVIFTVSGFWHGANWTFLLWGMLHALFFLPLLFFQRNRKHLDTVAQHSKLPHPKELLQMSFTFALITIALVVFRSNTVNDAFLFLGGILQHPFEGSLTSLKQANFDVQLPSTVLWMLIVFIGMEWMGRKGQYALAQLDEKLSRKWRWAIYLGLMLALFYLGNFEQNTFIYFQF